MLTPFTMTGKWPDDPEAFLKAKAALGCQLAQELASGFGLHARPSEHCVDVLAHSFAFRLFLSSERCAPRPLPNPISLLALHPRGCCIWPIHLPPHKVLRLDEYAHGC